MPFEKGQSGNPAGRPKGSRNAGNILFLLKAVDDVSKKQGKSIYKHFVERAYVNDKVLIALMKKVVPDMIYQSEDNAADLMEEQLEIYGRNGDRVAQYKEFLN